ncbi:DUF721 domain-containing protein [bacterium]|nr:DUF721 domain-containing protein [bacterium]
MKDLKAIIPSLLELEHSWRGKLFAQWGTIIGPLATAVRLEKVDGSTLFVAVSHPAWAQELRLLTPLLLEKIKLCVPDAPITAIKCAMKTSGPPRPLERKRSAFVTPRPVPLSAEEHQLLATFKNEALQSIFAAYLVRCKTLKGRGNQ